MKLNAKGQVTIPADLRQRHGLVEGDLVDVIDVGGQLTIVYEGADSPGQRAVDRMRGRATTTASTDDLMELLRGE